MLQENYDFLQNFEEHCLFFKTEYNFGNEMKKKGQAYTKVFDL